jgi:hypothetical protein
VDDQDKAPRFHTETLEFQKQADFGAGPYRWLTVASPEEPDGPELHLEPNASPVATAYQQGLRDQGTPAAMFHVSDIEAEHDRLSKLGVKFTMPVLREQRRGHDGVEVPMQVQRPAEALHEGHRGRFAHRQPEPTRAGAARNCPSGSTVSSPAGHSGPPRPSRAP